MISLAAQHKQKLTIAADSAAVSSERDDIHRQAEQIAFRSDLGRLKAIKSRRERNRKKSVLVEKYQHWLDAMIRRGALVDNAEKEQLANLTMWAADCGEYERALVLTRFAIAQDVTSISGFERDLVEIITASIVDGLEAADLLTAERGGFCLRRLCSLVDGCDMNDATRAKLYKARGVSCLVNDREEAAAWFEKALDYNPRCGVKRYLKTLDQSSNKRGAGIASYSLSAAAAARLVGVSTPTIIRHAKRSPDKIQHFRIPTGSRTIYKFNKSQLLSYFNRLLQKDSNNDEND